MRLVYDVSRRKYIQTSHTDLVFERVMQYLYCSSSSSIQELVSFQSVSAGPAIMGTVWYQKKKKKTPLGYIYKSVRSLFLCYSGYSWFFSFYFPRKLIFLDLPLWKLQSYTNSWAYSHCLKLTNAHFFLNDQL